MSFTMKFALNKKDVTYSPGHVIEGTITFVNTGSSFPFVNLYLTFEGILTLSKQGELTPYTPNERVEIVKIVREVPTEKVVSFGTTVIQFSLPLEMNETFHYYDTYHGFLIKIDYTITCDFIPHGSSKPIRKGLDVIICNYTADIIDPKEYIFNMTSDKLQKPGETYSSDPPFFQFSGKVSSRVCNIIEPFSGELLLIKCSQPVRSIDLRLVRLETVSSCSKFEVTEIETLQIADGDVEPNLSLPLHMIFPKLLTCINMKNELCCIDFEVHVIITFADLSVVSESIPLLFYRSRLRKNTVWTDP
ncbi:Down syndrome critical region protein 3-like protein A (DSCR3A) [Monocercomonoides exilis]|uniref:Down syndrome critical region protein 3-like protein A (DSCR3A) n=1 Tax=Monocercomonoides exilis TaxID=2049356 RepID=UPI0035595911|nr:Down syndrome critical region protein 3-like protein A (DSCR3A) [Monocercomonoides exilis]|eukprot:MONOS_1864.1-p1 / transcript=MONOS_1864.1 / gene=MONOS_1864 / organism=Monocercomonoides_exilis_PA203 / gene_product= Down syndrome critical region protein 3 paralogue A (DSCR3A) / transcript_product= Down syndrome critical region protein 3 paralogue A (DSCR3A) / location=Mono_scaffold00035:77767-79030(-) / protein_length=304 / sequence_SO=supercontig / SO=protein_coding / is_pseudo=false